MKIIRSKLALENEILKLEASGKSIGFVPTMGFLHEGHLSLVKRARQENDGVIVSIYVNPLQFGPQEDFQKYPRDEKRDLQMLEKAQVDVVFLPEQKEFADLKKLVPPKRLISCLCGKSRPGHFSGVATIVKAFFEIIQPDRAYFGQKDYQQCLTVKWLSEQFFPKTNIVICPIVREADGLAMSSRNSYLTKKERLLAPLLFQALNKLKKNPESLAVIIAELNARPEIKVDYLEFHDAKNLDLLSKERLKEALCFEKFSERKNFQDDLSSGKNTSHKIIIAGAIYVGNTRIIDNILV